MNQYLRRVLFAGLTCLTVLCGTVAIAQTPQSAAPPTARAPRAAVSVQGTVKDDTGGIIPGAPVTLTDANGTVKTTTTGSDGSYRFRGIAPGAYTLSATYSGLQVVKPVTVTVVAGQAASGNIIMSLQAQQQEITVNETVANQVSTDPTNNASALVLQKEDLDALPDDPDDLQADLQALAGPSAGPGGNQIYVDGFTGGQLPPKASIREIRINSNPFSAEFDKLGYGRIQIFTKPGSDKFHGQASYNISDGVWNSRNPFLTTSPPFRTQQFGGNVSGPINKHASFFVDFERRQIDDNGIITATIPTADFLGSQPFQSYYSTPQRRTSMSPRVDYQIGANNTLSVRYRYLDNNHVLTHIGSFELPQTSLGNITLPSNGYSQDYVEQSVQIVETAVLSTRVVNETHFEFERDNQQTKSSSALPQLNVGQSFVAGGSGYSAPGYASSHDLENYYELQNYTTATWGAHTTKFGARLRTTSLDNYTPQNFNGSYDFLGQDGRTSIQQYLTTVQLLNQNYNPVQIHQMGYGPSKFTINQGNPHIGFSQMDVGPFVQDDWRVRPNLTVSAGVRLESQNNINDHADWAPRVGFAWSPGSRSGNSRPKTVFRGGWGLFYDRFGITNVEQAYRSNLVNQYVINNPTFAYDASFSTLPSLAGVAATTATQKYVIDQNLRAPRLMQTVIGMDRQLASHTTLSLNVMNSRGTHELLTDDINAPIPTLGALPPGVGGNINNLLRPNPTLSDIYDYQSTGIFKQTQVIASINSQVGRWLTLFGRYSYTQAHSNTDGLGYMPSDPYNIAQEWGRSALDIHHSLFIGGSVATRWGIRLSPFIVAHTGTPFNITTGTDIFGTGSGAPTARPEVTCDFSNGDITQSCFNPRPVVGAPLIERNYGTSPGYFGVNLRASKTWGFGTTKFQGMVGGARAGGGGGGHFHGFGGETTEHRYNLTASVNARNIFNHENLNTPNGSLTSPYFLESTGIAGGYGPEQTVSNQRRIDLQLRFAF
ncbi:MAG: carboxypeptidase regulatory-like domain-containing protein [Acidobacteriota bacterium]|nr:carboxypeptidase regulatory-like domain-containing protein [Acidobacteriota bacterium]